MAEVEVAELILDGVLDYETGEYIGAAVGYPRTIRKYKGNPKSLAMKDLNEYGYTICDWKRMKKCTREVIIYLHRSGLTSFRSRQKVMDDFLLAKGIFKPGGAEDRSLPKNSRKYSIIHEKFEEFKSFVKSSYDKGE